MKDNYKNLIYAVSSVVIILPLIFIAHDYIYVTSHLEKIEFERIDEPCHAECKQKLESQGFSCSFAKNIGYACVPPVDEERIEKRQDYWDQLRPYSYGYLDLVYSDRQNQMGLLQDVKVIDEQHVEAIFYVSDNVKNMRAKSIPDDNYYLSKTLAIGDTFIPRCYNDNLFVYKLHDIEIREDVSLTIFTYRIGQSDAAPCEFPQVLEHSFGISFE